MWFTTLPQLMALIFQGSGLETGTFLWTLETIRERVVQNKSRAPHWSLPSKTANRTTE